MDDRLSAGTLEQCDSRMLSLSAAACDNGVACVLIAHARRSAPRSLPAVGALASRGRPAAGALSLRRLFFCWSPFAQQSLAVSEPEDQPSPSAAASSAGSEPSTELESASQALATIGAAPSETMLLLESPQRDDNHDVIVVDCSLSTSGAAIGYGQRGHDRSTVPGWCNIVCAPANGCFTNLRNLFPGV
ncbi:hypothetical protein HPB51_014317 [Rhipicephalus microplus]|uniref:Uncharacterized protein n=1 Tax=Rhipicephalus microplus TaxID=6941 RepID=A0A9J6DAA8_RHIMP|nr:hypothetical protein HPB51_014317 [Rhipicephalus microplus]